MLFTALNWIALIGWSLVAATTVIICNTKSTPSAPLLQLTLVCELISAIDVVRIAVGHLRGDLILGIDVHYTRLMMYCFTMSHEAVPSIVVKLILLAWSLTEVTRYPMVLFPKQAALKTIRYAVPLVTFPLGAGTEAYAAWLVLNVTPHTPLKVALFGIVLVNVIGGTFWYPSMVAKVGKSLREPSKAKQGE